MAPSARLDQETVHARVLLLAQSPVVALGLAQRLQGVATLVVRRVPRRFDRASFVGYEVVVLCPYVPDARRVRLRALAAGNRAEWVLVELYDSPGRTGSWRACLPPGASEAVKRVTSAIARA